MEFVSSKYSTVIEWLGQLEINLRVGKPVRLICAHVTSTVEIAFHIEKRDDIMNLFFSTGNEVYSDVPQIESSRKRKSIAIEESKAMNDTPKNFRSIELP